MRIPNKVKVGAYTFKIIRPKEPKVEGKGVDGYCSNSERIIAIRKSSKGVRAWIILLHECIHAIEFAYDLSFSEDQVHKLDHALTAFLIDNKLVEITDE